MSEGIDRFIPASLGFQICSTNSRAAPSPPLKWEMKSAASLFSSQAFSGHPETPTFQGEADHSDRLPCKRLLPRKVRILSASLPVLRSCFQRRSKRSQHGAPLRGRHDLRGPSGDEACLVAHPVGKTQGQSVLDVEEFVSFPVRPKDQRPVCQRAVDVESKQFYFIRIFIRRPPVS